MTPSRETCNRPRFVRGGRGGHYESWFQRANHPTRPLAFWVRYTVFAPAGRPDDAVGELWAVWSDGERRHIVAAREEHPIARCAFAPDGLDLRIAAATLDAARFEGSAALAGHTLGWSMAYSSPDPPLLLLPGDAYARSVPRAKALTGSPRARFDGTLTVDGEAHPIDGWVGSQNHNWGSRHTDRYAWGQVVGFDDAPEAVLEVATARVLVGPLLTPPMTLAVLRLGGRELRFDGLAQGMLRARGRYAPFRWDFATEAGGVALRGSMEAPPWAFVALPYGNPPGGVKTCLNTKLARCELSLREGGVTRTLRTESRAAFEMLSSDPAPAGVVRLGGG